MEYKETKATNTIAYKGTVTIKRISRNGKVKSTVTHNAGQPGLFNFLLYALAYQYDSKKAPYAIMGYSTTQGGEKTSAFSKFIVQNHAPTLYQKVTDSSSSVYRQSKAVPVHRVEYSFLVPSSVVTASSITMFRLVNSAAVMTGEFENIDENNISAEINLSDQHAIAPGNDNLLIYWDLEFSNADNGTSTTPVAKNTNASTATENADQSAETSEENQEQE